MAARSICHRFVRLYKPSMPEKPTEESYAPFFYSSRGREAKLHYRTAEMKSVDAFFPSPQQVVGTDIPTLRTAGLSARKAEYSKTLLVSFFRPSSANWGLVQDLAAHFADGRLSTEKLLAAEDEELYAMLTSIRGIGRVSVTSPVS